MQAYEDSAVPAPGEQAPHARAVSAGRFRAVIADDEPLARGWVRRQLEGASEIEVVGEAGDGFQAMLAIDELSPDLVFLDVQMPGVDGFGVLEMLEGRPSPEVVFITAFDRYAVKAFDVNAVDYLMKPFSRTRFKTALERALARLQKRAEGGSESEVPEVTGLLGHLRRSGRYIQWLLVKTRDKSVFLKVPEIDWIEASRNNVLLHVGSQAHSFSATMKSLEEALDPNLFLRIHRSTIVNLTRVRELSPWFNGEYRVLLKDGTELTLSANHRSGLARFRRLNG